MKKIFVLVVVLAVCMSNVAFAQSDPGALYGAIRDGLLDTANDDPMALPEMESYVQDVLINLALAGQSLDDISAPVTYIPDDGAAAVSMKIGDSSFHIVLDAAGDAARYSAYISLTSDDYTTTMTNYLSAMIKPLNPKFTNSDLLNIYKTLSADLADAVSKGTSTSMSYSGYTLSLSATKNVPDGSTGMYVVFSVSAG